MEVGSNIVATSDELCSLGIDIEKLRNDLTLPNPEYANRKRFGKGRFYGGLDKYICFLKKIDNKYIIPRYYTGELGRYGNKGRSVSANFNSTLRPYQADFIKENKHFLDESTGVLLEAACGSGKTILGIYISLYRGRQTMVVVPTYYLAKQWKQKIEEFTDASSVIITSKDTEIPVDSDFTIVVMDLFTCRYLPKELRDNVGHVILDEAHRIGADKYLPILDEIPAKYRTALTATFRRSDGVHRILAYHFGVHLKMESRFPRPFVYGVRTNVKIKGVVSKNKKYENFLRFLDSNLISYHETKNVIEFTPTEELRELVEMSYKKKNITKTAYHEIVSCLKRGGEMSYSVVDSYLNEHSGRRKMAISIVQKCLDAGRNVLFLSKRKDTLRALNKYFAKYKPMLIVSETNERSAEDEEYLQKSCPLILGVTQLAKEGLDIDRLDTLVIHLPMVDTEQAIGRISRLYAGKKNAIAFYLVDDCPITYSVYSKAKKFFAINAEYKGDKTIQTLNTIL